MGRRRGEADAGDAPWAGDPFAVRVLQMRRIRIGPAWNARHVRSSYWRLYVHDRDGAGLVLPERRVALTAERVHLVPAWVHFSCDPPAEPVGHLYAHFDWVGVPGPRVRALFPGPLTLGEEVPTALLEGVRAALAEDSAPSAAALLRGKALVHQALGAAVDRLGPEAAHALRPLPVGEEALYPVLQHVEQHLAARLRNDALAREARLSTDQFVRRFQRAMGQTPAAYVAERRVAEAARRLAFSEQPIEAVAEATGFANRHHFTRVFTRWMGVPPGRYRKRELV